MNVRVDGDVAGLIEAVADDVARAEVRLGHRGRVLVRPSGTEPFVRIMVEADTHDEAEDLARSLAAALMHHATT